MHFYDQTADFYETIKSHTVYPRKIILCGERTSGKSTFLRRLIQLNIAPVGRETVTRFPIEYRFIKTRNLDHIQVTAKAIPLDIKLSGECILENSNFHTESFSTNVISQISFACPTIEELGKQCQSYILQVYNQISTSTNFIFQQSRLAAIQLTFTIHTNAVPSISVIDLPGWIADSSVSDFPGDSKASDSILSYYLNRSQYKDSVVVFVQKPYDNTSSPILKKIQHLSPTALSQRGMGIITHTDVDFPVYWNNAKKYCKPSEDVKYGWFMLANEKQNSFVDHTVQRNQIDIAFWNFDKMNLFEKNLFQAVLVHYPSDTKYESCVGMATVGIKLLNCFVEDVDQKVQQMKIALESLKTAQEKLKQAIADCEEAKVAKQDEKSVAVKMIFLDLNN